jgi:integrase
MRKPTAKPRVRKDGVTVYDIQVRIGDRVVTKTCATEQEALDWAEDQRVDRRRGVALDPKPGRVKLADYAREWLENRTLPNGKPLAPKTIESYRGSIEKWIIPELGDEALADIRLEDVRRWHRRVASRTGENSTAKAYKLLKAILATAVEDERIPKNPCRIKGAGQEHCEERPFVNAAAALALAEAIEPRLRAFVLVAAFGGLRLGELLGLQRRHVDLGKGTVRVEVQWLEAPGGRSEEAAPKTRASVRTVKLPAFVVAELDVHLAKYVDVLVDGERVIAERLAVFPGWRYRDTQPISRSSVYDRFKTAKAKVIAQGVDLDPRVVIHDLRHTAGTLGAHTGATTKELMARLGHSTSEAAMRYQHAAQDRDAEIAAGLDRLVERLRIVPRQENAG